MSGEGAIAMLPDWAERLGGPAAEMLGDVLAYLERRRANAATIASKHPGHDEIGDLARDRRRQLDIQIDELRAGLHLGAAALRDDLAAPAMMEV